MHGNRFKLVECTPSFSIKLFEHECQYQMTLPSLNLVHLNTLLQIETSNYNSAMYRTLIGHSIETSLAFDSFCQFMNQREQATNAKSDTEHELSVSANNQEQTQSDEDYCHPS